MIEQSKNRCSVELWYWYPSPSLSTDAMANPSPAKSMGDPGITPLSPSHTQVTPFSNGHGLICSLPVGCSCV